MSDINSFSATRATECGDYAETTAFERYGVKTSEKANLHNEYWLTPRPLPPRRRAQLLQVMTFEAPGARLTQTRLILAYLDQI